MDRNPALQWQKQNRRNLPLLDCAWVVAIAVIVVTGAQSFAAAQEPVPHPPAASSSQPVTVDALSVVKVISRAIQNARSSDTLGNQRVGTGVVLDAGGLVMTIGYLIIEAEDVELSTADGKVIPATVIGYDNATGLGLVKALAPLRIKPVDIGESESAREREMVLIVGFDGVAPAYIVSKRPFVGYWEYLLEEAIYTAPVTVNWSGAALLNLEGKLLGIGSMAVNDAMGTRANIPGNMFVPIDIIKPVLGDFIANGKSTTQARPWIGVSSREVQGNLIVTRVSRESPAEDAGLRAGDVIVGIGGQPVKGQADFYHKLWSSGRAGAEIPVDVLKGNRVENFKIKSMDRSLYFRQRPMY